jgi:hypothetical protein
MIWINSIVCPQYSVPNLPVTTLKHLLLVRVGNFIMIHCDILDTP